MLMYTCISETTVVNGHGRVGACHESISLLAWRRRLSIRSLNLLQQLRKYTKSVTT